MRCGGSWLAWVLAILIVVGFGIAEIASCNAFEGSIAQHREEAMSNFLLGNFERAFALWRELAEADDIEGERNTAFLYANGLGVEKNMGQAEAWYRRAADRNDARAQNALGVIYSTGMAGQQDLSRAVYWYRRAAENGSAAAQFSLGQLFDLGRGVARDYAEAMRWYLAAANQGLPEAQYEVGHAFSYGTGVPQDDIAAYMWFQIAALNAKRRGTEAQAEVAMERLRARMNPPDVATALERAKTWQRPPRNEVKSSAGDLPRF